MIVYLAHDSYDSLDSYPHFPLFLVQEAPLQGIFLFILILCYYPYKDSSILPVVIRW